MAVVNIYLETISNQFVPNNIKQNMYSIILLSASMSGMSKVTPLKTTLVRKCIPDILQPINHNCSSTVLFSDTQMTILYCNFFVQLLFVTLTTVENINNETRHAVNKELFGLSHVGKKQLR